MLSLHLTGSPWFLLLLPIGLFILWRQYPDISSHATNAQASNAQAGPPSAPRILFGLQALALLLLVLSLTAPELRRHRVEFHNPAVLLLRDQSASFRNGAYLGLSGAYAEVELALVKKYRSRRFEVRVADFQDRAWPVSGFAGADGSGRPDSRDSASLGLTSLAAAADFADSAAIPNLQAIFVFSDGLADLDSGKASRTWAAPVFPVLLAPDSIGEVQPVDIDMSVSAGGKHAEVAGNYRTVGSRIRDLSLRLIQNGKTISQHKFAASLGTGSYRFPISPEKSMFAERSPVRAVLQPADPKANFDSYNDTLAVAVPGGLNQRRLYVLRPVRSLDEKGMVDILSESEKDQVVFFGADEAASLPLTAKDQVWIEAGALSQAGRLADVLRNSPAHAVVYYRPGSGGNRGQPFAKVPWKEFTPAAEIRVSKSASDPFPDEVVRLKGLTDIALEAPEIAPGTTALAEMTEAGKRGLLIGRAPLGAKKRALVFLLPKIWGELFDPQADFATQANIRAFILAVKAMADIEEGAVRASKPARAYHLVPFDLGFALSPSAGAGGNASGRSGSLSLAITSKGDAREMPAPEGGNPDEPEWRGLVLPQGRYGLALRRAGENLWSDSLEVSPRAALELARIGFDRAALEEAALRSGGRMLAAEEGAGRPAGKGVAQVASMLPDLPAAQIRMEKTEAFRLHNTIPGFLAVLVLLTASWALRKKWDLD